MKRLFFILTLSLIWLAGVESAWASSFKSYREWKSEKIQEAQSRVNGVKDRLEPKKTLDPNIAKPASGTEAADLDSQKLEQQLKREQGNLETAHELTVSDYFAGYLTKLSDKRAAFKEVAGRLTAEEVAELMAAYADSVFGTQSQSEPANFVPNAQGFGEGIR